MKFNRKIEALFTEEDKQMLDGQSKICNWLYNQLLEMCKYDYYENNNENRLLSGRNLRDQVPGLKENYLFLKTSTLVSHKKRCISIKGSL